MTKVYTSPVARTVPFDNSVSILPNNPQEVQTAIEELRNLISDSSRAFTFCFYNGNAGAGRFLEFFPNIGSNEAPLRVIGPLDILSIVARTTATSATCTIQFLDYTPTTPVLLYTLTFNNQKEVVLDSTLSLFTVPANGTLVIRIASGSITKPHLYFSGQGG